MSNSAAFSPGTITEQSVSGTSKTVTGLTTGSTYYFRVQAVGTDSAGSYTSSFSTSSSTTTAVPPPASYTISSSNNGTALSATSNATCGAGFTPNYQWYANGSAWVSGDQYQTVSYTPNYNETITLTVNTRCYTGSTYSTWVAASNNASFYRAIPAPSLQGLVQWSGNRLTTAWNDICGGSYQLWLRQGSYTEYASPRAWSNQSNANSGSYVDAYAEQDNRVWSSASRVYYNVKAYCNGGESGWSNTVQYW
jgi:hypothetical protein